MISDVLRDSVHSLNRYLEAPFYNETYRGELRARLIELRQQMIALHEELNRQGAEERAFLTHV